MPLRIWTRQATPFGIPSIHPGIAVIKTEEQALDGRSALFQGNIVPAATLIHLIFEDVAVEDATVDQRDGDFFIVFVAVAVDEMPAPSGEVFVDTRGGTLPVFLAIDGTVNALTALEPVDGTEEGSKTEKEVWRHDRDVGSIKAIKKCSAEELLETLNRRQLLAQRKQNRQTRRQKRTEKAGVISRS